TKEKFQDDYRTERERNVYALKTSVSDLVGASTTDVLQQAYNRVRVLQLIYYLHLINPQGLTPDKMDEAFYQEAEAYIRLAESIYYDLKLDKVEEILEYQEVLPKYYEEIRAMAAHLNNSQLLEETEESTEDMTEFPYDDFGDYGDMGDGATYTADELKQAIAEQESQIEECQLEIRESELKIKQYQRKLDNKIIKSTMNGVVKSAGTVDEAVSDEDFIVITGKAGMYVKGTINELKRDTISLGDMVKGTSYDTGLPFMASITEVSEYPVSSDGYYGYGGDNSNASHYPFLAYIEDAEGMTEGDAELQLVDKDAGTGIYLENYYIRTESSGKSYVYIQGSDGLLKKQYVRTGMSIYGSAMEIKEGLTTEDKIAFPYGKDVVEGAQTNEVDTLNSGYSYYGVG
ncbi:MAG: hypothetical protein PHE06_13965, partial [Lachnospiraceae bacterium]|nr:hypothetical protein [Lachnospiraceae bacterium]